MTIPYFAAKGNHDNDWGSFGSGLEQRMAKWGIAPEYGGPTTVNYSVVHRGLKMVMASDNETSPSRAEFVDVAPEMSGRVEVSIRRGDRQEPVAVHHLERDGHFLAAAATIRGDEEASVRIVF